MPRHKLRARRWLSAFDAWTFLNDWFTCTNTTSCSTPRYAPAPVMPLALPSIWSQQHSVLSHRLFCSWLLVGICPIPVAIIILCIILPRDPSTSLSSVSSRLVSFGLYISHLLYHVVLSIRRPFRRLTLSVPYTSVDLSHSSLPTPLHLHFIHPVRTLPRSSHSCIITFVCITHISLDDLAYIQPLPPPFSLKICVCCPSCFASSLSKFPPANSFFLVASSIHHPPRPRLAVACLLPSRSLSSRG